MSERTRSMAALVRTWETLLHDAMSFVDAGDQQSARWLLMELSRLLTEFRLALGRSTVL